MFKFEIPKPTRKGWLQWAKGEPNIDPIVLAWVEQLPDDTDTFPIEVSPRSLEDLSFVISAFDTRKREKKHRKRKLIKAVKRYLRATHYQTDWDILGPEHDKLRAALAEAQEA